MRTKRSDGLGGAVVYQTVSVLKGYWDIGRYTVVL